MIKFKAGGFGKELITAVEVDRESEFSVWINGRRNKKQSDWERYFDKWEDAKEYLLNIYEKKVSACKNNFERESAKLSDIRALINPTERENKQ